MIGFVIANDYNPSFGIYESMKERSRVVNC
jgi:hypothetical protein